VRPTDAGSRGLLLPAAAFALTRVWLLLIPFGLIPYLGGTLVINDVTIYADWARILQTWSFPIGDEMWQYPPLAGPVFALGALVPPDPTVGLVLVILGFDTAVFAVLARAVVRGGRTEGLWAWVAAAMLVGPVWLTRFDVVPALFAVLALLAIARPVRSGIWMGVGAMLKVWPALLLVAVPRRRLWKAAAAFAVTVGAIVAILHVLFDGVGAFTSEQRARGLQVESVPAWFFLVAHHLGWNRDFVYRYGAMEVDAAGTEVAALVVTVVGILGLLGLALARLSGRLETALPADVALATVLVSIVTSRVLSPQYLVWVAAIAAVCLLDPRTRMTPVVLTLMGVAALGQVLYPMHYSLLLSDSLVGLGLQTIRMVLLLGATGWSLWRLFRKPPAPADIRVDPVEEVGQPA
jgi:hypothetical protein